MKIPPIRLLCMLKPYPIDRWTIDRPSGTFPPEGQALAGLNLYADRPHACGAGAVDYG